MLTPAFHFRILEEHFNGFGDNAENIAHKLMKDVKDLAKSGTGQREINVIPYIYQCTSDIICGRQSSSALSVTTIKTYSWLKKFLLNVNEKRNKK